MSKHEAAKKCFYYRQTYGGRNYCKKDFWCPGEPLNEMDLKLLTEVKEFYQKNGYAPCRNDISHDTVCRLKARFRIWKNVILAAELPHWNSGEVQQKKRELAEQGIS